jgi:SAM-dependent methyltransferase
MNASIRDPLHPSILYYDSDYPSRWFSRFPENFDSVLKDQGIADDVERYLAICREHGNNVVEFCCGTGRISIPLVMEGFNVTSVDVSSALLTRFKNKLSSIENFPHEDLSVLRQDVTTLNLAKKNFDVVICAFNSLLCIPAFALQQATLNNAASHLRTGGVLALDIWNPLAGNLLEVQMPASYFSRRREDNGNRYTRFAGTGKMLPNQVQPVFGWYEEQCEDGSMKRTDYTMEWRVIFRYEIELMLEKAGLKIINLFGGNRGESFETTSLKMFIEAKKM